MATINGNDEKNSLSGTPGSDVISGFGDDDTLSGNGGNDTINGGAGDDTLFGGSGSDQLNGGSDFDVAAYFDGGPFNKGILADLSRGTVTDAFGFQDQLSSIEGVVGTDFGDVMDGGASADFLSGRSGNDLLSGGAGDDSLLGGAGQDTLTGGVGADVFRYFGAGESPAQATARDVVTDFVAGRDVVVDRIDVSAIDANLLVAGNQAFRFVGDGANFSGAGQVRTVGDGFTIVQFEMNGDGVADMEIQLNGNLQLTADNFIL